MNWPAALRALAIVGAMQPGLSTSVFGFVCDSIEDVRDDVARDGAAIGTIYQCRPSDSDDDCADFAVAMWALNEMTRPNVFMGDRMVIALGSPASVYLMTWRGGGLCVTAIIHIPPAAAAQIVGAVESTRAER